MNGSKKARMSSSMTNQTSHFSIMGGLSPSIGKSWYSRIQLDRQGANKNNIPPSPTEGFEYMKKNRLLSVNPACSGGVDRHNSNVYCSTTEGSKTLETRNTPIIFTDWQPSDYNEVSGFISGTDYSTKKYFYNSQLALDNASTFFNIGQQVGDTWSWQNNFPPYYHLQNVSAIQIPNTYVPSPFPCGPILSPQYKISPPAVTWGWNNWAGDTTLNFGTQFYTALVSHLGHTYITTFNTLFSILNLDENADTTLPDNTLSYILWSGIDIYLFFAGLVTYNTSTPIYYSPPTYTTTIQNITELFRSYINGNDLTGFVSNGVLDTDAVLNVLNLINTNVGTNPTLTYIINEATKYLDYTLRKNVSGVTPIKFICRKPFTIIFKDLVINSYKKYKLFFNNPTQANKDALNDILEKLLEISSRQLSAFFGFFYLLVAYCDVLLSISLGGYPNGNEAIPSGDLNIRINWILYVQARYWQEHVALFADITRAAALKDNNTWFTISMNHLESCAIGLSPTLGDIFQTTDTLLRKRNFYSTLPF